MNWTELKPADAGLRHAAFKVFERPNLAAMSYLIFDAERGWELVVRIEADGRRAVEAGRIRLAGPDELEPTVGPITLAYADAMAERATRGDGAT